MVNLAGRTYLILEPVPSISVIPHTIFRNVLFGGVSGLFGGQNLLPTPILLHFLDQPGALRAQNGQKPPGAKHDTQSDEPRHIDLHIDINAIGT